MKLVLDYFSLDIAAQLLHYLHLKFYSADHALPAKLCFVTGPTIICGQVTRQ